MSSLRTLCSWTATGPYGVAARRFVGGGVLIAVSPVAVAVGLFVPGFAALGLGALLLLLPPRVRRERSHRSPLRVVRTLAAAGGRGVIALARGSADVGAGTFRAVENFAANEGRDGVVRIGRASAHGAAVVGGAASAGGSRGWAAVQVVALRVWRGLVAATRSLAREARSTMIRAWVRSRPMLRRAWAACLAGSRRAVHELAALARSASERLSALIDSRFGPRQVGSLPPRAPRPPPRRGSAEPVRRTPALRPRSRTKAGGKPPIASSVSVRRGASGRRTRRHRCPACDATTRSWGVAVRVSIHACARVRARGLAVRVSGAPAPGPIAMIAARGVGPSSSRSLACARARYGMTVMR